MGDYGVGPHSPPTPNADGDRLVLYISPPIYLLQRAGHPLSQGAVAVMRDTYV